MYLRFSVTMCLGLISMGLCLSQQDNTAICLCHTAMPKRTKDFSEPFTISLCLTNKPSYIRLHFLNGRDLLDCMAAFIYLPPLSLPAPMLLMDFTLWTWTAPLLSLSGQPGPVFCLCLPLSLKHSCNQTGIQHIDRTWT